MESIVRVLTFSEKGVDDLKEIFNVELDAANEEYTLKIDMVASPMYKITIEGPDEEKIKELLDEVVNKIKNNVKNGFFSVHQDVTVVKKSVTDLKFLSKFSLVKKIV